MSWWWPFRDRPAVLYGHGLDRWNFLGTTELALTRNDLYSANMSEIRANLAFFHHRTDNRRSFVFIGTGALPAYRRKQLRNHPFHVRVAEQWVVGEHPLFWPVNVPSQYLRDYMKKRLNMDWDSQQERWVESKPAAAPATRLRKRGPRDNITIVDFNPDKPKT